MKFKIHIHHHHQVDDEELKQLLGKIMATFEDFAAKQKEFNDQVNEALDSIQGDINGLNGKIAKLIAAMGKPTQEQQAILDDLLQTGQRMVDKAKSINDLTPPNPEPTPPKPEPTPPEPEPTP